MTGRCGGCPKHASLLKMKFTLPCVNRLQFSLAAAHGAVDAARPPQVLATYALVLLPVPGPLCTAAFALSSVLHFSTDLGRLGSIVLHLILSGIALFSYTKAVSMLLKYMCFIHIPRLVAKLLLCKSFTHLLIMLCFMFLFVKFEFPRTDDTGNFVFGHKHQLVVACHVLISDCFGRM